MGGSIPIHTIIWLRRDVRQYTHTPPFFGGVTESLVWNVHQSKMRNCETNTRDDQVRSQSTYISVSVNAIETKHNSLESDSE